MVTIDRNRPSGENQCERWYRNHARPNEELFVVELLNGHLGTTNGAVTVSDDEAALGDLCAKYRVAARTIRRWTFEEGAKVDRVTRDSVARMPDIPAR